MNHASCLEPRDKRPRCTQWDIEPYTYVVKLLVKAIGEEWAADATPDRWDMCAPLLGNGELKN